MRFDRIQARRFGGLTDLDTGPDSLPDLVVFSGPNEAGKSTFFRFLTSLLYGFLPANREQNRDAPWSGEEADGVAWIRMDDGSRLQVHRKLLSTPWGRVTEEGHERDIRNRPLDQLDRLPRTVFRQVFALTLSEVAGLEVESWAEVQDRLVNAMGARDVVPPRDVANQLEEEAGALWRPNRRGNQEVRLLGTQIQEAQTERTAARDRDRQIRDLDQRVRDGRIELTNLKATRSKIQGTEEHVSRLLPVHRQLLRIEQLRGEAGDPGALNDLPPDPEDRLATLRDQEAVLVLRAQELEGLEAGLTENRRRARSICEDLLGRSWSAEDRTSLRRLSAAAVRQRVREYQVARDGRRLAEAERDARPPPAPQAPKGPGPAAAATGGAAALGIVIGLWTGTTWLVVLASLGLAAVVIGRQLGKRSRSNIPELVGADSTGQRSDVARLAAVEASSLAAFRDALSDLSPGPSVLEEPSLELPGLLERLQELDRDIEAQLAIILEAAPARPSTTDSPREEDQLTLGFSGQARLGGVARNRGSTSLLRYEEALGRLSAARDSTDQEQERSAARRRSLEARLALLGKGDPDLGVSVAVTRMAAARTATELADDLVANHDDLEALREKIREAVAASEPWTVDVNGPNILQRQRIDLTKRIEGLGRTLERDDQAMARLRELPTPDHVEGEILALTELRLRLARERDKKVLLATLIRAADQRFRSERQPRVLRRAGEYLSHVTGGRYDEILTAEEGDRDVFRLNGEGHPQAVALDIGVSTGTREQAYLALRLAAVDELDDGGERFPIFVDEVFVNWDADRRKRGIELMAKLAKGRQVFVFTCHEQVAKALANLGGRVVKLETERLRSLEGAW